MEDVFEDHAASLTAPVTDAVALVPDDLADLTHVTRAIFVGVGGDARVVMQSGQTVTLVNLQAGVLYPFRIRRVLATGTTAAGLVGMH